jgi:hypothetical protein
MPADDGRKKKNISKVRDSSQGSVKSVEGDV